MVQIFVIVANHPIRRDEVLYKEHSIQRNRKNGKLRRNITVSKPKHGSVTARCTRRTHYESSRALFKLNESDYQRIQELSNHGLAQFQIWGVMRTEERDVS